MVMSMIMVVMVMMVMLGSIVIIMAIMVLLSTLHDSINHRALDHRQSYMSDLVILGIFVKGIINESRHRSGANHLEPSGADPRPFGVADVKNRGTSRANGLLNGMFIALSRCWIFGVRAPKAVSASWRRATVASRSWLIMIVPDHAPAPPNVGA